MANVGDYEVGQEDPVVEGWDPRRVRPGERAALTGRNFIGVRGLVIGGSRVRDLLVVNSARLEFTVPADATSTDAVILEYEVDYEAREPEMEQGTPDIERPTRTLRWAPSEHDEEEPWSTLRRLIHNAERLSRGLARVIHRGLARFIRR